LFSLKTTSGGSFSVGDIALIDIALTKGVLVRCLALQWSDGVLRVRELSSLFSQDAVEIESSEDPSTVRLAVLGALEHEYSELNRILEVEASQAQTSATPGVLHESKAECSSDIFESLDILNVQRPMLSIEQLNDIQHARILFSPYSAEPFLRIVGYEVRSGETRSLIDLGMNPGSRVRLSLKRQH
jgi:hypothetical protein